MERTVLSRLTKELLYKRKKATNPKPNRRERSLSPTCSRLTLTWMLLLPAALGG